MEKEVLFTTIDGVDIKRDTFCRIFVIDKSNCTLGTLLPYWISTYDIGNNNHTYDHCHVFYDRKKAVEFRNERLSEEFKSHPHVSQSVREEILKMCQ